MKEELNRAISGITGINEIVLFSEMANQFNNNKSAKCTYVKKVHKMLVEYYSDFKGDIKQNEIGDLLLLTFNKSKQELRMCVLQAKYRTGAYRKFLSCRADKYQWELLYYKPDVYNKSRMNIPKNILNFRHDYKSITAYGVFYHDKSLNRIDFLYTLPELFAPKNVTLSSSCTLVFNCPSLGVCGPYCCGCGAAMCGIKSGRRPEETLYTCSMDIFEYEVLSCRVGAPINDDGVKEYILRLLNEMKKDAGEPEVIDEILSSYDYNIASNDYRYGDGHPAAIIVIIDNESDIYVR